MPFPTPRFLNGREVFRVKPGTFFHVHHKHWIDDNGNLPARHLMIRSVAPVYLPEIYKGHLRDVTAEPTQEVDFNPPPPPPPKWKLDLAKKVKEDKATKKAEREEKEAKIEKPITAPTVRKRGRPKGSTNRKPQTGGKTK